MPSFQTDFLALCGGAFGMTWHSLTVRDIMQSAGLPCVGCFCSTSRCQVLDLGAAPNCEVHCALT
eukprot:2602306-Amphidinium_carterae.1